MLLFNVQEMAFKIVMSSLQEDEVFEPTAKAEKINEVTNILMRMYIFLEGGAIGAQG